MTLTHPRTVPAERARRAWASLDGWRLDAPVTMDVVAIIEADETGGRTVGEARLTGG